MRLSGMMTLQRLACALPAPSSRFRSAPLLSAGVLLAALATAGCAASSNLASSRIYLHGDERIVVSGTAHRSGELDRYECVGEQVLVCRAHGAVTECQCARPVFGWDTLTY